jgi:predicted nucleic acid-binding protein
VGRIRLDTDDLKKVLSDIKRFKLDFDDAYQYVAEEKYNLTIISFDNDFDRTERGRKIPEEIQEII